MKEQLKIKIHNFNNEQILRELIDEFIPPREYVILPDDGFIKDKCLHINLDKSNDKDEIKRELFNKLGKITGCRPEWGILTGIRPVKLAGEILEDVKTENLAFNILTDKFYLSEEKANLILDIYHRQVEKCGMPSNNSTSLYIGIPFCPTRCVYCSFTSNQVGNEEIKKYLEALCKEIRYIGQGITKYGYKLETIYIGGGTPTTLNADELRQLMDVINTHLPLENIREITVEAGRPDTITEEKLDILKEYGVMRISINPQSMKQETLNLIGRLHTPEDIINAFEIAKKRNFSIINADLIAGLPGEDSSDFIKTLDKVLELNANNITIHTLAIKRASRLKEIDDNYHYKIASEVKKMLNLAKCKLKDKGFTPYYLYRQKHMAGGMENIGYALGDTDGIYNVRIMDEHQTIIAAGAGGISKKYYKINNKLERIANVSNYQEYIKRIDEMIQRKENKLWR